MRGSKIAGRYATALLELSIDQNKVESVLADMKYLLEVSNEALDFQLLLDSPIVKGDKKIAFFGELFGQFEEISTSFVNLITKNGRESQLPAIAEAFDALVKEHKGIVPVTIISAKALDNSTKEIINAKLDNIVKGQLEITEVIDEKLIGGFIIRLGDKQIDASVANQFNELKQRLTR